MILMLGSHDDDLLYVSSLITDKKEETLVGGFSAYKGRLFTQEILLVSGVYTSSLASAIASVVMQRYFVTLVLVLGRCYSINKSYKKGSVIIAKQMATLDVDLIDVANTRLHTVPGFPTIYRVQQDVIGYVEEGFAKRTIVTPIKANLYSTDSFNSFSIQKSLQNKGILGDTTPFVVDTISFGAALACHLHDVPCVSIKVVERDISEEKTIEDYVAMLDCYENVGKAVIFTVGDVARNDVLRVKR